MAETRWYAAIAKAGQELLALGHLERQGFAAYCPHAEVERLRHGKVVRESEPLFPRYVLVAFDLGAAAWRAVNGTRGIIRLVSFSPDGRPASVPRGEVERLQEREKRGELRIKEYLAPKVNDRVRIKSGFALDQIGQVVRTKGDRVTLLLHLLGGEVRVIAPAHALEVVEGVGAAVR